MTEKTEMQRRPATVTAEEAAAIIREHGYVIIDRLVPESVMDGVEAELRSHLESAQFGDSPAVGLLTRRTGAIIARSATARNLITNDLVLGVVKSLLSHASTFHVSLTETIFLSPGSQPQFLHQDQMAFEMARGLREDYEVQISTLWAMSDYTEEMGATRIVPESHRAGPDAKFSQDDTIPAVMPRGSVMIYSGRVYHGSGENRSNRVRKAINVDYAVGWLRQEENQYLSCPPEIARSLPEELLKLMGYQCSGALGYVDDRRHPLSVVLEQYRDAPAVSTVVPGTEALLRDIMN